jgi:hypothetical protein
MLLMRLMLQPKELFRLTPVSRSLKVVAGAAWVTANGQDIFLASGESLSLPPHGDVALISALGNNTLILEVFGTDLPKKTYEMGWFSGAIV